MAGLVLLLLLSALPARGAEEADPLQGFNRKIFRFNDFVDAWGLEPMARGWRWIVPGVVRTGLSNFFDNLGTPVVALNSALQGKGHDAVNDVARLLVNTTLGLGGFIDVASRFELDRHDEDFGQTLGVWGVPPGPYLVLPFLGPSSPREMAGMGVDATGTLYLAWIDTLYVVGPRMVDLVNSRAAVIDQVRDIRAASFDFYAAVRNGYRQRRQAQVEDRRGGLSVEQQESLYELED